MAEQQLPGHLVYMFKCFYLRLSLVNGSILHERYPYVRDYVDLLALMTVLVNHFRSAHSNPDYHYEVYDAEYDVGEIDMEFCPPWDFG